MRPVEVLVLHQLLRRRASSSSLSEMMWSLSQRTPRLTWSRISFTHEEDNRRDLVRDGLGRMEVPGVEGQWTYFPSRTA